MNGYFENLHRSASMFAHAALMSCLILPACVFFAGGPAYAGGTSDESSAAALVNGTVISRGDFQREFDRVWRSKGTKSKLADESKLAELKREALENLVTRELLLQESRRRNIKVAPAAIDREFGQLKRQFANEGQFAETMTRLKLNEALIREQMAHGLAIRALVVDAVGSKITVSDDETKTYFERHKETFTQPPQVHLSHILVAVDTAWKSEQKKAAADKTAKLRERLAGGEDFARLAAKYSDDTQSKDQGGDIGWFSPGQLVAALEKKVEPLKAGEVSPVIEDRFGFQIIKVVERKAAVTPPFDELKGKIRGMVKQEKGLMQLQPFIKKLRDGAKVEIRLGGEGE
jgi:parvulin-like peptidyl-prolyl isomerase